MYEIDSNVFNICGLKLKDNKRAFIYNIESYYKNKFNEITLKNNIFKSEFRYIKTSIIAKLKKSKKNI